MTDSKLSSNREQWQDEKWYDRTRYQVLLFVGGIALFVLAGAWISEAVFKRSRGSDAWR